MNAASNTRPPGLPPWAGLRRWLAAGAGLIAALGAGAQPDVATEMPLRGVVLRQALQDFVPAGVETPGLDLAAAPVVAADAAFQTKATALLGQPITLALLHELTAEVVLAYRRAGRPLADAAVPEQNISTGTVQVIILEAHLGTVKVEGARYFSAERIQAALRTQPGEPLYAGTLFSDLDWLNKNPFRRVDLVYERGRDLGTTDVVLRVTERRPWQAFAGYDNENVAALGRDRWFAGVRAGNLWGAEHQLNLLYTQGRDAAEYRGIAADYTVPLRWRHLVTVNAAFAEPNVDGPTFDSAGRSWRLGLRYAGELPRTRLWEIDWAAGYEIRSSDNDILFGGTSVFSSAYQTHEFLAEIAARRPGPAGESTLKAAVYLSPGGIGPRNASADLSAGGRSRIGARYAYLDLGASHRVALPRAYALSLAASARLTGDRLPPSSEFALGGANTMPGYSEATVLGDSAVWAQAKLQTPVWHVFRRQEQASADAVRFSASYNLGRVWLTDRTPVEAAQGLREQRQLESIGLGVNYEFSRHLQVAFTYGWQLRPPAPGVGRSSRGHVSAVLNF
ncbi:Heme/hemopexin transporter protein HuxB precursor [Lacunisphaera limnophila]|uniref:Heme/hemopexin transporter protein HuxB n=1 Tax=Lacunisphaera limnophila TaxID=1838286 RepID=A0A1D8ARY0_9BACT|nr:ShlB/FhaC/HecB family hemolysin secretion/activation protein [Lacunisphaera limnophila]AOS43636.1 Heme/hemopexin transporter protein HuxB precursor [Lacunisphaera limnophila]